MTRYDAKKRDYLAKFIGTSDGGNASWLLQPLRPRSIDMLFVISGASCVGKSTVRLTVREELAPEVESVEFFELDEIPPVPDIRWRQLMVERVAARSLELQEEGRHMLLAGDPVAAGEVLAVPSTADLDVAICLLDADAAALDERLDRRMDPPEIRHLHHGFAAWLRAHATDPTHMPFVLTDGGWDEMEWARWSGLSADDPRWEMTVIDTSDLSPYDVGVRTVAWINQCLAGTAPTFPAGWYR